MTPKARAAVDVVLIVAAWLVLFVFAPHQITSDGDYRWRALDELFTYHLVPHDKWPLVGSLFIWPLWWIGHFVKDPVWWVARYNCFLLGLGALALWRILRAHVAAPQLRLFLLLLLTSSMLPHETVDFGAETFNALAVTIGLAAWFTDRWILATVLLALGVANMPASLVGLALAMGFSVARRHRLRAALPPVLAVAVWMTENYVRKGGLLKTGYDKEAGFKTDLPYSGLPDFSYPAGFGVLSLLFSFGKGLLFFAPGIFLPWRRERAALSSDARDAYWGWALYVIGLVAVYCRWWSWYGGYAWGPRFLVTASVPAAFVLAHVVRSDEQPRLGKDLLVLAALALSAWAGASGPAFNLLGQPFCQQSSYRLESFCWYVPEFSVLFTPFVAKPKLSLDQEVLLGFGLVVLAWVAWPVARRIARAAVAAARDAVGGLRAASFRF